MRERRGVGYERRGLGCEREEECGAREKRSGVQERSIIGMTDSNYAQRKTGGGKHNPFATTDEDKGEPYRHNQTKKYACGE